MRARRRAPTTYLVVLSLVRECLSVVLEDAVRERNLMRTVVMTAPQQHGGQQLHRHVWREGEGDDGGGGSGRHTHWLQATSSGQRFGWRSAEPLLVCQANLRVREREQSSALCFGNVRRAYCSASSLCLHSSMMLESADYQSNVVGERGASHWERRGTGQTYQSCVRLAGFVADQL